MPDWIFWLAGFVALGAYGAAQRAKQAAGLAERLGLRFIGSGGYGDLITCRRGSRR